MGSQDWTTYTPDGRHLLIEHEAGHGDWHVTASDGGHGAAASLTTALREALDEPGARSVVAGDEARQSDWTGETAAKIEANERKGSP